VLEQQPKTDQAGDARPFQLRTGPGYVFGAVVSLAVLGAGVVMLSLWAPPVMTAEELARLPGRGAQG